MQKSEANASDFLSIMFASPLIYSLVFDLPLIIRMLLVKTIIITYPHNIKNVDGTTSVKADQSALLTHSKTALYSINTVIATKDNEHTEAQLAILLFFTIIIHPRMQNTILTTKHKSITVPTKVIFI